jgi:hypothetical protein
MVSPSRLLTSVNQWSGHMSLKIHTNIGANSKDTAMEPMASFHARSLSRVRGNTFIIKKMI